LLLKRKTVVTEENSVYRVSLCSPNDLSPKTNNNQLFDAAKDYWSYGMVCLYSLLKLQGREKFLEEVGDEKRDIKAYVSSTLYPLLSNEEAELVEDCLCSSPSTLKIRRSSFFADIDFEEVIYDKIISEEVHPSKRLYSKSQSRLSQGRSKLTDSLLQTSQLFDWDKKQGSAKRPLLTRNHTKFNSFSTKGLV
jgi:hypothetical protein